MKKENVNRTLWISGLLTGALVGIYLYQNKDQYKPQQKKLKGLVDDLKKTANEFGSKILQIGQEQLEATKRVGQNSFEATKEAAKNTTEAAKNTAESVKHGNY
jgi:gas vesicle protein